MIIIEEDHLHRRILWRLLLLQYDTSIETVETAPLCIGEIGSLVITQMDTRDEPEPSHMLTEIV